MMMISMRTGWNVHTCSCSLQLILNLDIQFLSRFT